MITITLLLKRKPGTTKQQFRTRYERHADIAHRHLGHLYLRYLRNYTVAQTGYAEEPGGAGEPARYLDPESNPIISARPDKANPQPDTMFDVITTITLADEDALAEMQRICAVPEIFQEFMGDEAEWLDQANKIVFITDEVSTPHRARETI